jgi:tetratricopeptide (TPR) repeat protein
MSRRTARWIGWLGVSTFLLGCSTRTLIGPESPGTKEQDKEKVRQSKASFDAALGELAQHDRSGDWTNRKCKDLSARFIQVNEARREAGAEPAPAATYNAGLSLQRCGLHREAKAHFEQAASLDSEFHPALAQLVLYAYRAGHDLDRAIADLEAVIRAAKFQNVEALVSLATLQMERGRSRDLAAGRRDLEAAQQNLQRAMAIDDGYMPAYNQLAILYLERARASTAGGSARAAQPRHLVVAGSEHARANQQQLDLAALVASQAIRKNPNYAPIHNTAGLIQVELGDFNGAVGHFRTARKLDPGFVEAHLNYAAVNLSFRGFEEAMHAYRAVVRLRPRSYEAHLGLALALRGQIRGTENDSLVDQAQRHLDRAKHIAPNRPEAYYNEAILTQEFKAKASEKQAKPMLKKALSLYGEFITRAGGQKRFSDAIQRSKERQQDIRQMLAFLDGT